MTMPGDTPVEPVRPLNQPELVINALEALGASELAHDARFWSEYFTNTYLYTVTVLLARVVEKYHNTITTGEEQARDFEKMAKENT